jgi:DNA-binding MarR family transcriptional regulator
MEDFDTLASLERIAIASVALTARAIGAVDPELTFLQWRALVVIGEAADGPAIGDLASRMGSQPSAVSRLVGRLVRRGLVTIVGSDGDRRVRQATLTDAGQATRVAIMERRSADLAAAAAQWTGDASAARAVADLAATLEQRAR